MSVSESAQKRSGATGTFPRTHPTKPIIKVDLQTLDDSDSDLEIIKQDNNRLVPASNMAP
jgi:hypothetical protein